MNDRIVTPERAQSATDVGSARILVADDEAGVRTFLAEALTRSGYEVVQVEDGAAALRAAREARFDVVFTDLRLPELDGMALLRTLRAEQPQLQVVVLTAYSEVSTAVEAMKLGALDYLEKPVGGPAVVRELVLQGLSRRASLVPSSSPRAAADSPLTFGAPAMRPVVDALAKVAKTSATVLLTGESGSGKEVAARAIHRLSARNAQPFVAINCAVLTEALLESELFGHEKGAFTGAHALRRGKLELADGGTLFLDEVGELAPNLQAKLLRALEEREIVRIGGSRPIKIDVRWVAATNRDLRAMVDAQSFRDDLYHRLAVFPVRLPALRERREDIVPLAETLLASLCGGNLRPQALSEALVATLRTAPWPGNVRELRNALERALILADGAPLAESHFALDARTCAEDVPALNGSLEALERAAIQSALRAHSGNRRSVAQALGIGLRTLYVKLRRYQLA